MKKVVFMMAGIFAMMLVGCSDGSSSAGASNVGASNGGTSDDITYTGNTAEGVKGLSQFPAVPAIPE